MNYILGKIQTNYDFNDYQIAQLRYLFLTVSSELSKFVIFSVIFRNEYLKFMSALVVMLALRSFSGGLHCRHYWSCFAVSLSYLFLSINFLPMIPVSKTLMMFLLMLCILATYLTGPVTSEYRPVPGTELAKRCRIKTFVVIFAYYLITYIIPENPLVTIGFWVIILHTLQLLAAKILRKEN